MRKVDGISFSRIGEAVITSAHEFVVRIGLPPVEAGEEIEHVPITEKHGLGVIAAAIEPSTTRVRPDISSATGGFSCRAISTRHGDIPGCTSQGVGGIGAGSGP